MGTSTFLAREHSSGYAQMGGESTKPSKGMRPPSMATTRPCSKMSGHYDLGYIDMVCPILI